MTRHFLLPYTNEVPFIMRMSLFWTKIAAAITYSLPSFNILKKLIPHIMKVGGWCICSKMAWMIVPCVIMNFLENFLSKTKSADMLST